MKIPYLVFAAVAVVIAQELPLTVGESIESTFDTFLANICQLENAAHVAKKDYVSRMTIIHPSLLRRHLQLFSRVIRSRVVVIRAGDAILHSYQLLSITTSMTHIYYRSSLIYQVSGDFCKN